MKAQLWDLPLSHCFRNLQCYKVRDFTYFLMKHQVLGYFIYMGDIIIICDNIISNTISGLKNFNISPKLWNKNTVIGSTF